MSSDVGCRAAGFTLVEDRGVAVLAFLGDGCGVAGGGEAGRVDAATRAFR